MYEDSTTQQNTQQDWIAIMTEEKIDIYAKYKDLAEHSEAWPFQEAKKLLERINYQVPDKGYVTFEVGYDTFRLPHMGTYGDLLLTNMVRNAFTTLSNIPTQLIVISDDMDPLYQLPTNIPNKRLLEKCLNYPLTRVPDPFNQCESYGESQNQRLSSFLDTNDFDAKIISSTSMYEEGVFDSYIEKILANYDEIRNLILPLLDEGRRRNYSMFLPICPISCQILPEENVKNINVTEATITFINGMGEEDTLPIINNTKLQWRLEWAIRWAVNKVDYKAHGKNIADSSYLVAQICEMIGGKAPQTFVYELFLGQNAQKMSKDKGTYISMEDWLSYGPKESLSLFIYNKPRTAKKIYFDVIPKTVDDYFKHLSNFQDAEIADQLNNPVFHINYHKLDNLRYDYLIPYTMLLNLAIVTNAESTDALWKFIKKYQPDATPDNFPNTERLCQYAIRYYKDFVKDNKEYKDPTEKDKAILQNLLYKLSEYEPTATDTEFRQALYEMGVQYYDEENLREWFELLYSLLLGQTSGPRLGNFIAIYGLDNFKHLISKAMSGVLYKENLEIKTQKAEVKAEKDAQIAQKVADEESKKLENE